LIKHCTASGYVGPRSGFLTGGLHVSLHVGLKHMRD